MSKAPVGYFITRGMEVSTAAAHFFTILLISIHIICLNVAWCVACHYVMGVWPNICPFQAVFGQLLAQGGTRSKQDRVTDILADGELYKAKYRTLYPAPLVAAVPQARASGMQGMLHLSLIIGYRSSQRHLSLKHPWTVVIETAGAMCQTGTQIHVHSPGIKADGSVLNLVKLTHSQSQWTELIVGYKTHNICMTNFKPLSNKQAHFNEQCFFFIYIQFTLNSYSW